MNSMPSFHLLQQLSTTFSKPAANQHAVSVKTREKLHLDGVKVSFHAVKVAVSRRESCGFTA